MEDLQQSYKDTRKTLMKSRESLQKMRDELKNEKRSQMAKLTLPTTFQKQRLETEKKIAQIESDIKTLGEMISDAIFILEWLGTGRCPGNRRGIERRAAYQRVRPYDPVKLQAYIAKTTAGGAVQAERISDKERERIDFALGKLTPRERACFEMVRGNGLPYAEAAELLGIEKSSVQWFIVSAEEKLHRHANQTDLFDYIGL